MNKKKVKELDKKIEQILNEKNASFEEIMGTITLIEVHTYEALFKKYMELGKDPIDTLVKLVGTRKKLSETTDAIIDEAIDTIIDDIENKEKNKKVVK